jgi:hypothetical protein
MPCNPTLLRLTFDWAAFNQRRVLLVLQREIHLYLIKGIRLPAQLGASSHSNSV